MPAPKFVKITGFADGTASIVDGETGAPIRGVTGITVVMKAGELPTANIDIHVDYEGTVAAAHFTPVFETPGKCETCKHWSFRERDHGWGSCDLTVVMAKERPNPASLARVASVGFVTEYENINRFMETKADFGCVQWQPKDGDA